jgi:hypothetical protein
MPTESLKESIPSMKQTKPAQAMELRSLSPGWSQVNDATLRQ